MNTTAFFGGGEQVFLDLAKGFLKRGYRVSMVCAAGSDLCRLAEAEGIRVSHMRAKNLSFLNPAKLVRLYGFFRHQDVDTVMFTTSHDLKLGGLAARLAGIRQVVYRRGLAVPIRDRPLNRYLLKHVATHLIANSRKTRDEMLRHLGQAIHPEDVMIIGNGIHLEKYGLPDPEEAQGMDSAERKIILGNAGRLTEQKGQIHLVELARILKDRGLPAEIRIAGEGPMREKLEALIRDQGLEEDIVLPGFVQDMPAFMRSIDIFVLTSLWEGFGIVITEAMACGKPVIAFDLTSNPELIRDGENGYLVPYPDMEVFASRVMELAESGGKRRQFGRNGRKWLEANMEFDQQLDILENYLFKG